MKDSISSRRDFLKMLGALPLVVAAKQALRFRESEEAALPEYELPNIWDGSNKYWAKNVPCDAVVENGYGESWYTANVRAGEIQWERIGWAEMRCAEGTYYLPIFGID